MVSRAELEEATREAAQRKKELDQLRARLQGAPSLIDLDSARAEADALREQLKVCSRR